METMSKMIDDLRLRLERAAKDSGYNFLDPEIVRISQQLDKLIVAHMQHEKRPS
ncbi:aspartyl-phosphate phosphatase Spo0E family protein [Brevibacillus sp. M2.1A]|uniref:aspartyl-phosphate phosphatase Spo0E family protein n=1 Tax=Brevibacillus TaxID=55080 RepID=UPI00156A97E3|nr:MULTISPECIES: aspartyl-phosphate phosphatase Spo0E family protein [Brevibacillus]MBY0087692.1 aspartyl-phosphate phosphatase Spo0E family protein [Brevibacillus brevis]MCC8436741.1 aspartyl-phosphate phosphatase Spo0E family protein [Brevibacillus sp. M2.1A]MCE0448732.1 aspartyl-phosphate phosphatase Spo0E family protein [Brevibacillus sp. AF8]UKK98919.1 aspartyl-phosphate phosphatase Spo0E family protein [Brevibacillus brevis]